MKSKTEGLAVGLRRRAVATASLDVPAVGLAGRLAVVPDVGPVDGEAGDDLAQGLASGSAR